MEARVARLPATSSWGNHHQCSWKKFCEDPLLYNPIPNVVRIFESSIFMWVRPSVINKPPMTGNAVHIPHMKMAMTGGMFYDIVLPCFTHISARIDKQPVVLS